MLSIFDVIIFRFNGIIKQPALFLAIAEVYKTEGNEACLKEDYSNAGYFYTEGLKANCKDEDLAVSFYSKYSSIQCAYLKDDLFSQLVIHLHFRYDLVTIFID